ncbi:helix-turn-helix domain-containing protein [Streptomyces sp. ME19-01-6]|uniref:winged helix-turn-helix transcriptional regulator n=1 Tax=Streptomyces sp. ME19-01-6 TaxID=3028686 RepID=UPI0029B52BBB|nr:helix-turn-helix domain-containing protein [Streptomyces sp. ME19-01-6]MDX3226653.1 helix-turn-helix domain-containing protein [Streptomyces sp. ME19-01-6]
MSQRHTGVTDQLTPSPGGEHTHPLADCPLREVLALIGDKWSTQVLVQLGSGPSRFTELERAIEGISRRMLTLSLRSLERNGLITRTVHPDAPPRVEYATTPLTEDIREPLEALAAWADRNRPAIAAARRAYDTHHGDDPHPDR